MKPGSCAALQRCGALHGGFLAGPSLEAGSEHWPLLTGTRWCCRWWRRSGPSKKTPRPQSGRVRPTGAATDARFAWRLACCLARLQFGQVLLATVGSTAPLWDCWARCGASTMRSRPSRGRADQHRPGGRPGGRSPGDDRRRAGRGHPRRAGLQLVWARVIGHIEADLEGFALDLRDWRASAGRPPARG